MRTLFRFTLAATMLGSGWLLAPLPAGADILYVYSVTAPIHSLPTFTSPVVTTSARGTALKIDGAATPVPDWQAVKLPKQTGWVPAATLGIVSPRKKISADDLASHFDQNKHAVANYRRRISDNSHAGPANSDTTGMAPTALKRDEQVLRAVEKLGLSNQEISSFHAELSNNAGKP